MDSLWLLGNCWDFIKRKVSGMLSEFFKLGNFETSLNANFLVLSHKKGGTKVSKDFRSIILPRGLYKISHRLLLVE